MTDIATVRELLRRAILTLCAIPDPEFRYRRSPQCAWPPIVQDPNHAYNSAPPKFRRFQPTAADLSRYLPALDWLTWYEQAFPVDGPLTVHLFWEWTLGKSNWELQQLCITNRRRPARSRNTPYNRMDEMCRTIAIRLREDKLLQAIDELNELNEFAPNQSYGRDCVESDLRDLPTSPKACISAISEPLSPKDEARAHKLLTKRMQRNHLAAMQRKRTNAGRSPLMAAR